MRLGEIPSFSPYLVTIEWATLLNECKKGKKRFTNEVEVQQGEALVVDAHVPAKR
jgi:hypothetical protein